MGSRKRFMRLLLALSIAMCGLACASGSAQDKESTGAATTRPAARHDHNGVLRDPVGDRIFIEGTIRGEATVR